MRNKVPDGAKRGTAFFRPKFPKETGSQRTLILTIFGVNFGRNQTRVVRCINRGVLQFLEPGHLRFERRDHRQRTTPYLENTVQYTSNFGGFGGCPPPSPPLVGRGGGNPMGCDYGTTIRLHPPSPFRTMPGKRTVGKNTVWGACRAG